SLSSSYPLTRDLHSFPTRRSSDLYASQTIVTVDGKSYQGLVSPTGDGTIVVLQPNGEKVTILQQKVDSSTRSKVSAMPEGLLNSDRKSTRLNSSHSQISYAVFCLK